MALAAPFSSSQINAFGGAGASQSAGPATPELVGMAFAGVAMPSDGAGSFLLNPARLASVEPGISASLLARRFEFDRFSDFQPDDFQNAYSLTAGFPIRETNWRAGVGFGRSLGISEQRGTDIQGNDLGTLDFISSALVLGAAIAYDGPVEVSLGLATRRISEPFISFSEEDGASQLENESGWGVDLGLQARYAFLKSGPEGGVVGSVGLGYALQNWGPDIGLPTTTLDGDEGPDLPFPLAARARLGWSGTLGYEVEQSGRTVRAVQVDVALEASHSLVRQESPGLYDPPGDPAPLVQFPEYRVAGPLGRIRPLDALLGRNRDPDLERRADVTEIQAAGVVGHRAVRLQVFETLTLRYGAHGNSFDPKSRTVHAFGGGLSLAGLFRLARAGGAFAAAAERGDLHLSYAHYAFYENGGENQQDLDQPWVLGLTLVARWP